MPGEQAPALDAVTVDYAARSGTALSRTDFFAATCSLTFRAGELEKTIRVDVPGDSEDEGDESFSVDLTNPVGASFGGGNRSLSAIGVTISQPPNVAYSGAALEPPITVTVEFVKSEMADSASLMPGARRAEGRCVTFVARDMPEAYRAFRSMVGLA